MENKIEKQISVEVKNSEKLMKEAEKYFNRMKKVNKKRTKAMNEKKGNPSNSKSPEQ
jgi:hypothetical protein